MSKRLKKLDEVSPDVTIDDGSDDEVVVEKKSKKKKDSKPPGVAPSAPRKKDGYNWSAIGIMLLFILPAMLTGYLYLMDFLYPEAAQNRLLHDRLLRCYDVANPEKVKDIDHILKKYKGKEGRLFAMVTDKYGEDYPACMLHR
jgi:hypothetical protein